jgi:virginiamycin A acetyltransferase
MSFFRPLYIFIYNTSKFILFLFNKKINWESITSIIEHCEIHPKTKLVPPCVLTNVKIDKGTYLSINSKISYTTIGKFCSVGPNLTCGWGIHPINGISTSPVFYSIKKQAGFTLSSKNKVQERKLIKIGNDVFIGANVTILDGISIGDGAVIGAGAVVSKDIPPYAIAIGCPIKIIKYRFPPSEIKKLLKIQWWDKDSSILELVESHFFNIESFIEILEDKLELTKTQER